MGTMRNLHKLTTLLAVCVALIVSVSSWSVVAQDAAAKPESAHEKAEQVKNELVTVIRSRDKLTADGGIQNYFDAVKKVLEPVVDFPYIARGVMGEYAQNATPDQRDRFAKKFETSLVSTYAKGLAGYGNHEITVLPAEGDVSAEKSLSVVLQVKGGDTVNILSFSMRLNREEEWKITNMVLNGINLGKTFRNQFDQSMRKSGDLDQVIDNWGA